jgi:hypothetical protein
MQVTKERELLEWALIFLYPNVSEEALNLHKEITELLAQPEAEQEPVAWKDKNHPNLRGTDCRNSMPLYTSPLPKREPLSDIEIIKLWRRDQDKWSNLEVDCEGFFKVVKEVETHHKIGVDDERR